MSSALIHADTQLPEITGKAIVIAIVLSIVMASANAYLGLKVGLTIAGSIPAAITAMGLLRLFKHYNILENNVTQTAVSSATVIAAATIFTMPATLVIGAWTHIHYWPTAFIGILGGILGVLFAIPMRRALLDDPSLRFPEGLAIGEVLKQSTGQQAGLGTLLKGGILGAVISIAQDGFRLVSSSIAYWTTHHGSLFGIGLGFSPALIGAGFIVGLSLGISIFIGVLLGWIIGVPIISAHYGLPSHLIGQSLDHVAFYYWSHYVRYVGIGTIGTGGIWAIIALFKPMIKGVAASLQAISHQTAGATLSRTEQDISIKKMFWGSLVAIFGVFILLLLFSQQIMAHLSTPQHVIIAVIGALLVYGVGFIVAAICGYFAGLVGSSISPISCMILMGTMTVSAVLLILSALWDLHKTQIMGFVVLTILINALIATVGAVTNDTLQDLKAGRIIGATPWKQQCMMFLGVITAALVLPWVIELLFQAYGIAGVFPRPGMDTSRTLLAPQASLIAAMTRGIFAGQLPWGPIGAGIIIALVILIIDTHILKKRGLHLSILGVGTGIYLPFSATVPLIIGGIAAGMVKHLGKKRLEKRLSDPQTIAEQHASILQKGLVAGCGLVAGASIAGVLMAIPFAISGSSNVLVFVGNRFIPYANVLGILSTVGIVYWLYRTTAARDRLSR